MNREDTKKAVAVMQAWLDGKTIQVRQPDNDEDWRECNIEHGPFWTWHTYEYRIKPEKRVVYLCEVDKREYWETTRRNPNAIKFVEAE